MKKVMQTGNDYLIIGAGIAGLTAATSIRSLDKTASITLINGESYPPYKRTNLSKFFASGFAPDDFTLVTKGDLKKFYNIELLADTIKKLNYEAKIAISARAKYSYKYLILATGAKYEIPPALKHANLKFYHSKQDTLSLQTRLREHGHIAVLGGGVQGMETCYELLKLGKRVSLFDPHEVPLARCRSPYISAYLKHDLENREVQCHWQQRVTKFSGSILRNFATTICCFGTKPVTKLFPPNACLQDNLLLAADVFACGDNIIYRGTSSPQRAARCSLWHEAMALGQLAGLNAARLARGDAKETLIKLKRKTYRTKIEVANKLFFLAPPIDISAGQPTATKETQKYIEKHFKLPNGDYYQLFLNPENRLIGASLIFENRELLKPLQQAIWEQTDYEQICALLNIPLSCEFDGIFKSC